MPFVALERIENTLGSNTGPITPVYFSRPWATLWKMTNVSMFHRPLIVLSRTSPPPPDNIHNMITGVDPASAESPVRTLQGGTSEKPDPQPTNPEDGLTTDRSPDTIPAHFLDPGSEPGKPLLRSRDVTK